MKHLLLVIGFLLLAGVVYAGPVVEMKTSMGTIRIELNQEKAPQTVNNFLTYVDQKFYDGTVFHRVIKKFMIQGGGFNQFGTKKVTLDPIKNEANNGLKNRKGSISMARTGVVDSATSQFFINLVNNSSLDHSGNSPRAFGYAVFGHVISGLNIVEKIGKVKTITKGAQFRDYPEPQVIIESVRRI